MKNNHRSFPSARLFAVLATLSIATAAVPCHACSVCGCSLSSDWAAQGYAATPGFTGGVRFEYSNQTDLRSDTGSVDRSTLTFPNDSEIQQRTLNRSTWLELNYVANSDWALSLQLPYYNRFHTTIVDGDTDVSTSRANGPGDVRLLARYQLHRETTSNWGVQFGLKLPTGKIDQDFVAGPQTGELVDRGLQLGTGTTDLLAGLSWFGRPALALGTFAQLTVDQPLAARDDFLPSDSLTLSGGLRWLNSSHFTPQLQLNVKWEGREHGAESDSENSGSTLVYLSPGITAELGAKSTEFVFVQLPVLQRVNGMQLEPKWILSLGVNHSF
ncbi:MAG TPA: hypothetical protein VGM64_04060 [Lacunisphaera sp.]|jgi:hypothetical protein